MNSNMSRCTTIVQAPQQASETPVDIFARVWVITSIPLDIKLVYGLDLTLVYAYYFISVVMDTTTSYAYSYLFNRLGLDCLKKCANVCKDWSVASVNAMSPYKRLSILRGPNKKHSTEIDSGVAFDDDAYFVDSFLHSTHRWPMPGSWCMLKPVKTTCINEWTLAVDLTDTSGTKMLYLTPSLGTWDNRSDSQDRIPEIEIRFDCRDKSEDIILVQGMCRENQIITSLQRRKRDDCVSYSGHPGTRGGYFLMVDSYSECLNLCLTTRNGFYAGLKNKPETVVASRYPIKREAVGEILRFRPMPYVLRHAFPTISFTGSGMCVSIVNTDVKKAYGHLYN